jgi:glycosyltransferase involved in cell wall biosynthesis
MRFPAASEARFDVHAGPATGAATARPSSEIAFAAADTERTVTDPSLLSVVLVSTQRKWYGGEEQARLLARGLRDEGHRPSILARRGGVFAERMRAEGFEVGTFSGNGRSPVGVWQIRRHLRRIRPDVLHFNDPHALSSAGLASLGLGLRARIAARRVDFTIRFTARYLRLCDRVVCVSREVARVCRESGIPSRLLCVVPDGVDPSRVSLGDRTRGRRSLGLLDDQRLLLTVARLTDHKGHRFLLEALPSVLKKHPEACAAFVGDGDLADTLREQAKRLGVDSSVRFLGYRDDVPDLIRAADLFVFPSHMEGLGSTLIDVMLARRPIVTTTAGGIPDLTGSDDPDSEPVAWTVPPGDPPALAEAILDALESPEKRAKLQERAGKRAERLFTARRMIESTLSVYREVLEST